MQRILRPMLMGILALIIFIIAHITKQTKNRVLDLSAFSVSHGEYSHLLPKHQKLYVTLPTALTLSAICLSSHCPYFIRYISFCSLPLPYLPYSNTNYHYPWQLPSYQPCTYAPYFMVKYSLKYYKKQTLSTERW